MNGHVSFSSVPGRLRLDLHCRLDVTDRRSLIDFLDTVEDELGSIDVVVNNAGIIASAAQLTRLTRSPSACST